MEFYSGQPDILAASVRDYCTGVLKSLNNVTPADVYFGRDKAIIRQREKIKKLIIQNRRLQHQKQAA